MNNINWTYVLLGGALGYFGSGFVKMSPTIAAAIGAGAGYLYGGGTIPGLSSGSTATGTVTVPSTTVTAGT
jgi:hypothetical protein